MKGFVILITIIIVYNSMVYNDKIVFIEYGPGGKQNGNRLHDREIEVVRLYNLVIYIIWSDIFVTVVCPRLYI